LVNETDIGTVRQSQFSFEQRIRLTLTGSIFELIQVENPIDLLSERGFRLSFGLTS